MTHLQVDPPSYLKTPPLGGTLPSHPGISWQHLDCVAAKTPVRWTMRLGGTTGSEFL